MEKKKLFLYLTHHNNFGDPCVIYAINHLIYFHERWDLLKKKLRLHWTKLKERQWQRQRQKQTVKKWTRSSLISFISWTLHPPLFTPSVINHHSPSFSFVYKLDIWIRFCVFSFLNNQLILIFFSKKMFQMRRRGVCKQWGINRFQREKIGNWKLARDTFSPEIIRRSSLSPLVKSNIFRLF